ncbi:MAG TPA: hypothetical protein VGQ37_24160 [Vicinamibacterales bacterium]|jgi:hypothetical protein|nr:hypothetical protein [Vicinamibacterales bacterium]
MTTNNHVLRVLTIVALTLALAAPARAQEPGDWRQMTAALQPGTRLELHLKDGSHVDGRLVVQDADVLVVNPRTRIPVAPWRVSYSEIDSIEIHRREGLSPGAKVLLGLGAGAAAVFVGLLIAVAAISD